MTNDPTSAMAAGSAALAAGLPDFFHLRPFWDVALWQWIGLATLVTLGLLLCSAAQYVAIAVARRASKLTRSTWDDQILEAAQGPGRYALFSLYLASASRLLALPSGLQGGVDVLATWTGIIALAWFSLRFVKLASTLVLERVSQQNEQDVGRVRGLRTQITVLRHVLKSVIYVLTLSLLLLQLDAVKSIGMSLLASAGVAGLVVGLAAQKSISTLLAGIQLSITQPVRIGDTVIVENEWGWIEEISLTYVVVKVWDLRRLVVPMTYFLERPFQNWSKVASNIMGTVELHADYRTSIAGVREELERVVREAPEGLWDGKVQNIQVTGCTDRTMTLRALVSSSDAGKNWDLRVLVREKLIEYLQKQPFGLPVLRAEATHLSPPGLNAGAPAQVGKSGLKNELRRDV